MESMRAGTQIVDHKRNRNSPYHTLIWHKDKRSQHILYKKYTGISYEQIHRKMETDGKKSDGWSACALEGRVEKTRWGETSGLAEKSLHAAFAEYGISACRRRTSAWSSGVLGRQRARKQHGWKP